MYKRISDYFTPGQRTFFRRVSHVIEALAVFGIMYGAGGVTGYWIRDRQDYSMYSEMKEAHRLELERTNEAYAKSLQAVNRTIEILAGRMANTATTVEQAAVTSRQAAQTAQQAINKAEKVPEPTREQINKSVERANNSISKK